jgi:hypothetical protein
VIRSDPSLLTAIVPGQVFLLHRFMIGEKGGRFSNFSLSNALKFVNYVHIFAQNNSLNGAKKCTHHIDMLPYEAEMIAATSNTTFSGCTADVLRTQTRRKAVLHVGAFQVQHQRR